MRGDHAPGEHLCVVIMQVIPYDASRKIDEVYVFSRHVVLEGMRRPDARSDCPRLILVLYQRENTLLCSCAGSVLYFTQ